MPYEQIEASHFQPLRESTQGPHRALLANKGLGAYLRGGQMAGSNGDLRPKERWPESTLESAVGRKTGRRVGVGRRRVCGLVVVRPKFHPPINLSRPAGAGRHSCCGLALKLN